MGKTEKTETKAGETGGIAEAKLKSYLDRIERLQKEKDELGADMREVFAEAKGNGFDTKAMREVLKLRRMEQSARKEFEALVELYRPAGGI